jgi:hypothetical protein
MNKAFNTNAMRAIEWRIAIDKEIRIAVGQSCHIVGGRGGRKSICMQRYGSLNFTQSNDEWPNV